jgi:hypothetical protein
VQQHTIPSRSTKKCFTPTWEETPKIFPIGYPQINAPKFLLLSLKSFVVEKETCGYAKVIKKERKSIENRQVSEISKTMGTA